MIEFDAVSVVIVLESRFDGFLGKHRAVQLVGGHTVKSLYDSFIGQRKCLDSARCEPEDYYCRRR